MRIGDKVMVTFEMTIKSVENVPDFPGRAFACGDIDLGAHERMVGKRKTAYVSGVPLLSCELLQDEIRNEREADERA